MLLNFHNQDLRIDYISFKIVTPNYPKELIDYLFQIGFNCFEQSGQNIQNQFIIQVKNPIRESLANQWQVLFVQKNTNEILVHFTGDNGLKFYQLIQTNSIDWAYFPDPILHRFDLCYLRQNRENDLLPVVNFLTDLIKEIDKKEKIFKLEKDSSKGGYILKNRRRRSNNYFRVYQADNGLRFELEMKGRWIETHISLLVQNRLEEFEQKLSSHFLTSFGRLFPLHFPYLDWLTIKLRPIRQKLLLPSGGLNSDYLQSEIIMDTEKLIHLILFLNYAQNLDFDLEYLGSVAYRKVVFPVKDFIQFQNNNDEIPTKYQSQKVIQYFRDLQSGLHITKFKDQYYQSLIVVPQVQFEKHQKFTIANVWLVEKLFHYTYPFYLPNLFHRKLRNYEKEVSIKLLEIMTSESVEKIVLMDLFFQNYPSQLSNQDKAKVKKYLIELVQYLETQGVIESKYKYIHQGKFIQTKQLTTQLISEGFVIYEKIII